MSFFDLIKGAGKQSAPKTTYPVELEAPAKGTAVPMNQIPDEVFSTGVLGICCGVDPTEGKVYAPIDGKISQVTDTLHAIGILAGEIEILIHVGVDTVDMNGDGFTNTVKLNQTVKKGDLLLTMDLNKIQAAGHLAVVIMAITNSDDFASVEITGSGLVQPGNSVLRINK